MNFLDAYYLIKPLIPRRMQIAARRRVVKRQRAKYKDVWPINEQAGKPPEGWPGWPEEKKFALVLTHDVESRRGLEKVLPLARLEEKRGFRSCFNFVGQDYPVFEQIRKTLLDMGFEVGLHGLTHKGNLFRSRRVFDKQKAEINRLLKEWGAKGFRVPSMYHNLKWLGELDIEYDMSTFDTDPFEPQPDGVGTIFPFWVPPSPNGSGFVELPNTLPQDHTLFILLKEKNIDIWKQKLDWIAEKDGMALLNVHPDYLNITSVISTFNEYPFQFYEDFLDYIKTYYQGKYWHVLPREVAHFYKEHLLHESDGHKRTKLFSDITLHSSFSEHQPSTPSIQPPILEPAQPSTRETSSTPSSRRPLHVGMLVYSFYESDNRVMRYAETLASRGDQVEVVALGKAGKPKKGVFRGVTVYRIQGRVRNESSKLSYAYKMTIFFIKSLIFLTVKHQKHPFDLIHVHNMPDFLVFSCWLPKFLGAKIILDIHDLVPELYVGKFRESKDSFAYRLLLWLERVSCRFADYIIVANHLWAERVSKRSGTSNKCLPIINYPDIHIFKPEKDGKRKSLDNINSHFVILYPGSLNWHQGLHVAVKAMTYLKDRIPNAELHIYGDGPSLPHLKEMSQELELDGRVVFHPPISVVEVAPIMAQADVGIVPKLADGFGNEAFSTKSLEFMACAVPVVMSRTRVDTYYFTEEQVKFFHSGDPQALAEAIWEVYSCPEVTQRRVKAALDLVSRENWENKKHLYLDLVDKLLIRNP